MEETISNEFNSATENFNLRHPPDWVVNEDREGYALVLANFDAALDRFKAGEVKPGDFVLTAGFVPVAFFERLELANLNSGVLSAPDSLLKLIMPLLRLTGDNMEDTIVSDSELVSLSDEVRAGQLIVSNEQREGLFIVFPVLDGVIAFVSAIAYPGELGGLQQIASAIAASIEFTGSSSDLMAAFWGS
jgi:hypothetical protein